MKKQFLTVVAIQATLIFFFSGCKKDSDTTAPVILILGDNPYTLTLNTTYSDGGATASDNQDGVITSKIVATNHVNKDLKGTYEVNYDVSDAAGNSASAYRIVNVKNAAEFLAGSYVNAKDSCQTTPVSFFDATITTSNTENNKITINNFGAFGATVNIIGTLSGSTINFAGSQSLGGTSSIVGSATGTITSTSPLKFTVTYTWTDGSSTEVCTTSYAK